MLLFAATIPLPAPQTHLWPLWDAGLGRGEDAGLPQSLTDGFPFFFHRWFQYHVAQTLFHVMQVVLGYMVMLAVMSYNAWIFLGAIVGSTLGYFVVYPLLGRG